MVLNLLFLYELWMVMVLCLRLKRILLMVSVINVRDTIIIHWLRLCLMLVLMVSVLDWVNLDIV
jgi:hypothetical protein